MQGSHDDGRVRSSRHAIEPTRGEPHPPAERPAPQSRAKWVFFGFLAISAFFLLSEHRAHLFGYLPWLILLLCPLMHIFMHGGHGHGGHGHTSHKGDGEGEGR